MKNVREQPWHTCMCTLGRLLCVLPVHVYACLCHVLECKRVVTDVVCLCLESAREFTRGNACGFIFAMGVCDHLCQAQSPGSWLMPCSC